jgi:hypothetical protein
MAKDVITFYILQLVIFFKIFCQFFGKNLGKENSSINLAKFSNLMKKLPIFNIKKSEKKTHDHNS